MRARCALPTVAGARPALPAFVLPFVFTLFLLACARDSEGPGRPVVVVEQAGKTASVTIEIAATASERQQGLMFRQALGEDAGMLFLFPRDSRTGFWMLNTYVPLDIAYISANFTVIEVARGEPLNETPLQPSAPYRYVLEVPQGWFAAHGLGPGATVTLPDGLPQATG